MATTSTDAAARGILHDSVLTTFPAGSKLQYRSGAGPGASAVPTGTLIVGNGGGALSISATGTATNEDDAIASVPFVLGATGMPARW
jgi:hypothetical protein